MAHSAETVGISPKAILAAAYPAITTLVAVLINALASGEFDRSEVILGVGGVVTSTLAYIGAYVGAPGTVRHRHT